MSKEGDRIKQIVQTDPFKEQIVIVVNGKDKELNYTPIIRYNPFVKIDRDKQEKT